MMIENFEDRLDTIREELDSKSRGLSNEKAAKLLNDKAAKIAAQYGIKLVSPSKELPVPH